VGRGQRLALIFAAIAVAAGTFVVLSPGGDDEGDSPSTPTTTPQTTTGATMTTEEPAPPPKPEAKKVVIENGAVKGGEQRITVKKGEVARIDIESDTPDEIHLHGYDIYKDVAPGKPAKFRVEATLEGIFELEAHDLGHVIVAKLVVEP
jgi:hypothetical protein